MSKKILTQLALLVSKRLNNESVKYIRNFQLAPPTVFYEQNRSVTTKVFIILTVLLTRFGFACFFSIWVMFLANENKKEKI